MKEQNPKQQKNDSQISLNESSQQDKPFFKKEQSRLNSIVQMSLMKKQSLGVSFSGIIRSGIFKDDNTLSVMYSFYAGENWQLAGGQPSGISLISSYSQQKIVWNFPFGVTYKTMNISGWPQLVVVLYDTDYFGRSVPKGYGNVHMPLTSGTHNRKIKIFKPLQPTSFFSCINFMTSSLLEIKQPERYLGNGKQRRFLKVQYCGQIQVQIETIQINLQRHGYA